MGALYPEKRIHYLIYLYARDSQEVKYQLLINKKTVVKKF